MSRSSVTEASPRPPARRSRRRPGHSAGTPGTSWTPARFPPRSRPVCRRGMDMRSPPSTRRSSRQWWSASDGAGLAGGTWWCQTAAHCSTSSAGWTK
eukprot:1574811-Heterocapsa_arctica.AAC.1